MDDQQRIAFIRAIISNRGKLVAILSGLFVAAIAGLVSRLFGEPLSLAHQGEILFVVSLLLNAVLDSWAIKQTTAGTVQVQERFQTLMPEITVDGIPGPQTIATAEKIVTAQTSTATTKGTAP